MNMMNIVLIGGVLVLLVMLLLLRKERAKKKLPAKSASRKKGDAKLKAKPKVPAPIEAAVSETAAAAPPPPPPTGSPVVVAEPAVTLGGDATVVDDPEITGQIPVQEPASFVERAPVAGPATGPAPTERGESDGSAPAWFAEDQVDEVGTPGAIDWSAEEIITEPGWPMPGEVDLGSWTGPGAATASGPAPDAQAQAEARADQAPSWSPDDEEQVPVLATAGASSWDADGDGFDPATGWATDDEVAATAAAEPAVDLDAPVEHGAIDWSATDDEHANAADDVALAFEAFGPAPVEEPGVTAEVAEFADWTTTAPEWPSEVDEGWVAPAGTASPSDPEALVTPFMPDPSELIFDDPVVEDEEFAPAPLAFEDEPVAVVAEPEVAFAPEPVAFAPEPVAFAPAPVVVVPEPVFAPEPVVEVVPEPVAEAEPAVAFEPEPAVEREPVSFVPEPVAEVPVAVAAEPVAEVATPAPAPAAAPNPLARWASLVPVEAPAPVVVEPAEVVESGRFTVGGHAQGPGHEILAGVSFRNPAESAPESWARGPVEVPVAGSLVVEVQGAMNCSAEDLEVVDEPGFAPTEGGFTVRLKAAGRGAFAASGSYRLH